MASFRAPFTQRVEEIQAASAEFVVVAGPLLSGVVLGCAVLLAASRRAPL